MHEPAHSPLGPSAAERWIACPGSVLATKDLPDTDSEYSLLGTAAHTLAERCGKDNLPALHFLGGKLYVEKVDGESAEFTVDREMVTAVQSFLDYVNALPGDDYTEARVYYERFVPGGFGTMDRAKAEYHTLRIIDYKYGEGVQVFAKENSQLKFYALGFTEEWGWLYDFRKIELHVAQPRLDHFDSWETTPEAILEWAETVAKPAAALALKPGAPFKAGAHCKFCKIKATCTTRAKFVFEMNLDELDDLDDAIAKDAPPIARLTPAQIIAALRRKPHIVGWYNDIERYAISEINHGKPFDGWKLVEGRSNREWSAPAAEIEKRLVEAGAGEGIKVKLYSEPEIISPAQAEKVFGKKLFLPGTPLGDTITKPRGKPKLAPPEDERPAFTVDPSELEEVEDDAA